MAREDTTNEERRRLEAIKAIESETLALTERLVSLRRDGEREAERVFLLEEVSPAYSEWLARVNAFIDHQGALIREDIALVQTTAEDFAWAMVIFMLLAVAASPSRPSRWPRPSTRCRPW